MLCRVTCQSFLSLVETMTRTHARFLQCFSRPVHSSICSSRRSSNCCYSDGPGVWELVWAFFLFGILIKCFGGPTIIRSLFIFVEPRVLGLLVIRLSLGLTISKPYLWPVILIIQVATIPPRIAHSCCHGKLAAPWASQESNLILFSDRGK